MTTHYDSDLITKIKCMSFLFSSGRCINKGWVCDGDIDCEDQSDEDDCDNFLCGPPKYPCANDTSVCLQPEKLCNGRRDCPDGSDEGDLCGIAFFTAFVFLGNLELLSSLADTYSSISSFYSFYLNETFSTEPYLHNLHFYIL